MTINFFKYITLHIFLPLLTGTILYLLFAENPFPRFEFFKNFAVPFEVPNCFIYQIPDGLWSYAFCATFLIIWKNQRKIIIAIWAFLICSSYEFMQFFKIVAGTFDWWDIFAMGLGCFLSAITIIKYDILPVPPVDIRDFGVKKNEKK